MNPFYEAKPSDLECTIGRTTPFPFHLHMNLELIYCSIGSATISIEDKDITLEAGDLAIVFPNVIHALQTSSENSICTLLICAPSLFEDFQTFMTHQQPVSAIIKSEHLHPDILYVIQGLEKESQNPKQATAVKYLTHLLLARLLPMLELKPRHIQNPLLMHEIITYICAHYTEPISLDHIATTLGVSKFQISRLFSKQINLSFTDYVNSLRIDLAKTLLKSSTLSIFEVQQRCGFETQRHFNRVFKLHCDCSPSDYRQRQLT